MSRQPKPPADTVFVPCHCCQGTGRIELTGTYRETYDLLRSLREPINGAALARLAGCKPTAMNNRLRVLEGMGLVIGKQYGRQRLYEVTL